MKAIEQYFLVVVFITLFKMVLTFESVDEILKCDQIKVTEQYYVSSCGSSVDGIYTSDCCCHWSV